MSPREQRFFLAGLFFTTSSALLLEILDTRLLSVLTWYHLSFFAVSLAMFGLAAGGLRVYLGGERFSGNAARVQLARQAIGYAVSIPISHVVLLQVPLDLDLVSFRTSTVVLVALTASALLAAPFYFAGVLVGLALTRIPARIGVAYCVDLVGAGLGCLLAIPLLKASDVSTATFAAAAIGAGAALCFRCLAPSPRSRTALVVLPILIAATAWNATGAGPIRVRYAKGVPVDRGQFFREAWNGHSQIIAYSPRIGRPFFWGKGKEAQNLRAITMRLVIDGSADTYLTRWDGEPSSLDWVRHDVTSLPYHLRRNGDAAVIGFGGGRDLLTALWARSRHVTGIEINDILVDLVTRRVVSLSHLAPSERLRIVHDDARSFLTRTPERYDVLQMSLIDSWASTSAGAFTLSENGLYTREAWSVFLDTLKENGIFSVSRWFSPERISETNRLLALGTAMLIDRHVADPAQHVALVSRGDVATLLVCRAPFTAEDVAVLDAVSRLEEFRVLVAPDRRPAGTAFGNILASRTREELQAAIASDVFDYSPPTDERPYFFNLIKPAALLKVKLRESPGVVEGNLLATFALILLVGVSTFLVAVVILLPLLLLRGLGRARGSGLFDRRSFVFGILYFALIGSGFMLVQIPYMQRFSVYLGHPTYALVVILFSMILSAGFGSLLSEHVPVDRGAFLIAVPAFIAVLLFAVIRSLQPAIDSTIHRGFPTRALVVVAFTAPLSLLLGCCFPLGMRLVSRLVPGEAPWMWGINGACSVLASSLAVAISMWLGIHTSLYVAMASYAALVVPALVLQRLAYPDRALEDRPETKRPDVSVGPG